MNDKENFAFFAEGLPPLGINLAVIEYTLAPAARLDRIVAEVRRSVWWLAEHLGEYGADPTRLYVSGHSAGGHLTAMTDAASRGARRDCDQRHLRSGADPAQLPQRESGSRYGRGRAQQPSPAFAGDRRRACRGIRHPGIARIVPPVDRICPGMD